MLLLEQHYRAAGEARPIERLQTLHAQAVRDAAIEAALLVELAASSGPSAAQASSTRRSRASLQAQALDPRARSASSELERLARKHDRPQELLSALDALAERER